jgi:hypothetical protein
MIDTTSKVLAPNKWYRPLRYYDLQGKLREEFIRKTLYI